jgi:hypothetical protein
VHGISFDNADYLICGIFILAIPIATVAAFYGIIWLIS